MGGVGLDKHKGLRHGTPYCVIAIIKLAVVLNLAVLLPSCASPARRLLDQGEALGFAHRVLIADGFRLEAFFKQGVDRVDVLHVYLEGDGVPWAAFDRVSTEPTPRNPVMLRLMAKDQAPSLYLGRPCYNGHARDPGCSPLLWTHRRYAPEVVEVMAAALDGFLREHPHPGLVFLGHSGGGALALLLAQLFPATRAVVTAAANADIDVWADLHDYSRLQGSLNPANFPGGKFPEFHYLGEKDETVPPHVFEPVLGRRPNARVETVEGFDHVCCWEALWPKILAHLPR